MDVAGIGVQTITPTTGTAAQNPNPAPDRPSDNDKNDSTRVNPSSASSTGKIVDKLV